MFRLKSALPIVAVMICTGFVRSSVSTTNTGIALDCVGWWCVSHASTNEHVFVFNAETGNYACSGQGCHEYWIVNMCSSNHAGCGGGFALTGSDVTQIASAVKSGDAGRIEYVMLKYGDYVSYNRDREAIQVRGCTREAIIAHLPLDSEVFQRAMAD